MARVVTTARRRTTGRIIAVQEQRFRLQTENGQGLLLTLAVNANIDSQDLHRLRAAQTWILVEYSGEPNLATGVAYLIRPTLK
jgi:hypothetical protein